MRWAKALVLLVSVLPAACSGGGSGGAAEEAPPTTAATARRCGGGGAGAGTVEPGTERLRIEHDGARREVERVIPPSYDGKQPRPVILNLHGFTSSIEQQNLFSGLPEKAAARGYVLLTPQAADATIPVNGSEVTGPYWNIRPDESAGITGLHDDIGFLRGLLDSTVDDLCVDPARIYVTGNSNGAGMAAVLACALPGRLAAIAPVSGVNLAAPCRDLRAVSVVAFHGDADPLVPYEGGSASNEKLDNPSVPDAVGSFASAAGCAPEARSEALFADVTLRRWPGCRPGFDVALYTVLGGGHTWPGMLAYVDVARLQELAQGMDLPAAAGVDLGAIAGHMTTNVEATEVMLDFFDAHRLDRG